MSCGTLGKPAHALTKRDTSYLDGSSSEATAAGVALKQEARLQVRGVPPNETDDNVSEQGT